MVRFSSLDPNLINPVSTPLEFQATLNGHGTYTTEHFVLRLSPRVHELIDAITKGNTDDIEPAELFQAYSTYLHETIHWWQHVGSTAGLIISLAQPAQILGSMELLQTFAKKVGGVKPIQKWAEREMLNGHTHLDPDLAIANAVVNNTLDIHFYKKLAFSPKSVVNLERDPYFESVGHSYLKTYGEVLHAINGSCDFWDGQFPNPSDWEADMHRLNTTRCDGFYHGSRPPISRVGLQEIFEGQARFSQIQFLASSGGDSSLHSYRTQGYFTPLYANAFEEFLRLTGENWPDQHDSPIVALFLLICDLSINPTRGFPLEIESFEDFICDVDPGARFTRLCMAAQEAPELAQAIQNFSAAEYEYVSECLTERCGYDAPHVGLDAVIALLGDKGPVDTLMEEHRTFNYSLINIPVRVMISHYIDFCRDKIKRPEFFCWPGIWMAGKNATEETQSLFIRHLTLFQDRADTQQIYPRALPGRSPECIKALVNNFYSSMLSFDMALQWVLKDGKFQYNFRWLTGKDENCELIQFAKRQFRLMYGLDPDSLTTA